MRQTFAKQNITLKCFYATEVLLCHQALLHPQKTLPTARCSHSRRPAPGGSVAIMSCQPGPPLLSCVTRAWARPSFQHLCLITISSFPSVFPQREESSRSLPRSLLHALPSVHTAYRAEYSPRRGRVRTSDWAPLSPQWRMAKPPNLKSCLVCYHSPSGTEQAQVQKA